MSLKHFSYFQLTCDGCGNVYEENNQNIFAASPRQPACTQHGWVNGNRLQYRRHPQTSKDLCAECVAEGLYFTKHNILQERYLGDSSRVS